MVFREELRHSLGVHEGLRDDCTTTALGQGDRWDSTWCVLEG